METQTATAEYLTAAEQTMSSQQVIQKADQRAFV
jgi:hypothetical protein